MYSPNISAEFEKLKQKSIVWQVQMYSETED